MLVKLVTHSSGSDRFLTFTFDSNHSYNKVWRFFTPSHIMRYDIRSLQVNIPHSGPVFASLGSSITIPCLVSLSSTTSTSSSSPPVEPRVKWTVVSGGVETLILVARGQRVKVNETYRDRAALLNNTSSPDDLTLWLGDLRSNDSGHYRCEVQQGLEDASDLVQLKVKGVVFHYRDDLGRYAFSFHQARTACEAIGAQIATSDQLLAAYYDGYEQCDAGWLADQSVRYPIQVPREGCYGDMDGEPGVRNYGTMDPDDLFDVYCYVEETDGEVFHDSIPQHLSFDEAQSYCRAAGAELATTAQLYFAWSEGLDRCSPGWLSDGSVRYPIITPRDRCGGPQAGVKTLYRFSNQTGFPEPSSLHDVYCFRDNFNNPTDTPVDYMATEPEDIGQDVVILVETDQELQLSQNSEQEAKSVVKSFPLFSASSTEENLVDTHPTSKSDTTESPFKSTSTLEPIQPVDETSPTKMSNDSQDPAALITTNINSTENFTFHHSEPENTTGFPESSNDTHIHNQTVPVTNSKEDTQPSEKPKQMHETNLDFNATHANYTEIDSNHTQEENILEATSMTLDSMPRVKLDESVVEDPVQVSFSTQLPREDGELLTQSAQTTNSPVTEQTSVWIPMDGSGDISQENDLDMEAVTFIHTTDSSTSGPATHQSLALASSVPTEPQTAVPDPTLSSRRSDDLGMNIFSTVAHVWESSSSRQEGSTSLEIEDTVTMESNEKQLHPTKSEDQLISGVSLATTESPEGSSTSQATADSITAQYQTSDYRVHLDTATTVYEEASGYEPSLGAVTIREDENISSTLEENITLSQTPEEEVKVVPTLEEDYTATPTLEEEVKVVPTLEEDFTSNPTFEEEVKFVPTLEEDFTSTPTLEEEAKVAPFFEEDGEVASTLEEDAKVNPTSEEDVTVATTLEEETKVTPTSEEDVTVAKTLEQETKVSPTSEEDVTVAKTLEEETKVSPTSEEDVTVATTLEEETKVSPTSEEDVTVATTLGEETKVTPTSEEDVTVAKTLEEETKVTPTYEEDVTVTTTLEDKVTVSPTFEEEVTILPLDSQTSNWVLLTTTTGPQESLNDLEYNKKTSAAPDSSSSTKPTAATTKATTTTTHWSRRTWSPTTSTPKVFHQTAEPQKVTARIPPVDQGLVDVEFSLTQPPTLLILPNERAAVGGTGTVSDACVEDPCLNGGTCTGGGGNIKCLCLPTYGGEFCQTDLEQCEPGWDKFHGFCYRHYSQRLSWEVAEQHCRMQGAHLVSIMTPEEQSYINSNYKEYQWTGLNDKTIEDDFRWSDGNPLLYENWYRGQPDSYFLSGEDCVVMVWHDDGRWSDVPCNYHLSYTCKKGTSSCGPPPKVRNASIFGKGRQRYETNAVVRYHCAEGFQQKLNPVVRCLPGGRWERPRILCIREAGGPTQHPDMTSPTNNNIAMSEDEFEATKESPQFWDIKF
ncbi:brevican core protein-like [Scomber scombrus]|uniref:Brevican core protein-like n=1 Tax=Scomber scombrus TaxID=13677 RepID=A0AAV1MRG8_SCOSC